MVLLIDNYDSFVYNLARYVGQLGFHRKVIRNDQTSLEAIEKLNPSHIIISPGPCTPNKAGLSMPIIKHFAQCIPILGICLGHQAIGQVFGARIVRAKHPMHGKSCVIEHNNTGILQGLSNPLAVGRYHSLVIDQNGVPDCLTVTATSSEGEIMAIEHKNFPIYGVQFHPESVLTYQGYELLRQFLKLSGVLLKAQEILPKVETAKTRSSSLLTQ